MSDILCKLFGFIKYLLLIIAFGLVFFGIMVTYSRLEKSLLDALDIFIPFVFVLIMFIINLFVKSDNISKNLLYNLVCNLVFAAIIVICLRAMFDKNMLLYEKYGINFNPSFFSDNLSAIRVMLYMIGFSNIVLLGCDFIGGRATEQVNESEKITSGKKDNEKSLMSSKEDDTDKK